MRSVANITKITLSRNHNDLRNVHCIILCVFLKVLYRFYFSKDKILILSVFKMSQYPVVASVQGYKNNTSPVYCLFPHEFLYAGRAG